MANHFIKSILIHDFECLNSDFDMSLWNSVGTDIRLYASENLKQINNKLYFISTVGYSSNIFELDLKGNLKQLTNNTGSVDEYVITDRDIFHWFKKYGASGDI